MKILFCAPFPVPVESDAYSSGSDRKISLTIRILLELGHEVVLLNSSCTAATASWRRSSWTTTQVDQYTLAVYNPVKFFRQRRISKAIQALFAPAIGNRFLSEKEIDLVWIYNSYIFEARLALSSFKRNSIKIVFQIEDLPLARKRSLFNIKPRLDAYYFHDLCNLAAKILIVNSTIAESTIFHQNKHKVVLFPPIIDPKISNHSSSTKKFRNGSIKIGYFGELNEEKGVRQLLRVMQKLPANYELHLFGKGELEDEINIFMKRNHKVIYHGFMKGHPLIEKLHEMDVLLNPHSDISKMQNGVFPFKILEYIATGGYVITTPLPKLDGVDLSHVATYNYSDDALAEAIINAPQKYSSSISSQLVSNVLRVASFESSKQMIASQLRSFIL